MADSALRILEDDLRGEAIARFLRDHLRHMHDVTPRPESVHAFDLAALRAPAVTFWSAWEGETLCGCGALQELDAATGEIKSMRTAEAQRGRGIASAILMHILAVARKRRYHHAVLETGSGAAFAPARSLYEKFGFTYRGPFGRYGVDPHSVFMTKTL